jgi:hypothetical protein
MSHRTLRYCEENVGRYFNEAVDPHLYYVGTTRVRHRLFVLGK